MGILQHDSQGTAQIRLLNLIYINAVVTYLTILYIIKPVDQIGDGGLACTGGAHKGNLLPRFCVQFHIMQHNLIIVVSKVYPVKYHVAPQFHIVHRVVRLVLMTPGPAAGTLRCLHQFPVLFPDVDQSHIAVVHLRFLIHHLEDTLCTGHGHDNRIKLLTHLVNGPVKALVEGQETG